MNFHVDFHVVFLHTIPATHQELFEQLAAQQQNEHAAEVLAVAAVGAIDTAVVVAGDFAAAAVGTSVAAVGMSAAGGLTCHGSTRLPTEPAFAAAAAEDLAPAVDSAIVEAAETAVAVGIVVVGIVAAEMVVAEAVGASNCTECYAVVAAQ